VNGLGLRLLAIVALVAANAFFVQPSSRW